MNSEEKQSLIKAVNEASPEGLRQFIINQAQFDPAFFQDVTAQFGDLDTDAEFAATKKMVQATVRHNKSYGFIDYQGCIVVCNVLDDVINKYMLRFRQGHYHHAMNGLLFAFETAGKMLSNADSSSGALTDTFDRVYSAMKNLSTNIAPEILDSQKQILIKDAIRIFKRKFFSGWAEERYKCILNILPLVTSKSAKTIMTASKAVIKSTDDGYDTSQSKIYDKILQARILIQLGQAAEAKQFMDDNKDIPQIREVEIQDAVHNKQYQLAEQLCLEASKQDQGWRRIWEKYLIKIYDATDQLQKQEDVLESRLFSNYPDAYEPLKQLMQQDHTWEKRYPGLLAKASKKLSPDNYAFILAKEHEFAKLIKVVMQHPELTETYSPDLYESYPDIINKLYYQNVVMNEKYPGRKAYRRMGRRIKRYAEFGSTDTAKKWINELIDKYPSRPALAEELEKIKTKL